MFTLRRTLIVAILASLLGIFAVPVVHAQTSLSDEERELIATHCVSTKSDLNQLKATDALLRVNRGQVYEAIGSRLMDRFNTRMGTNDFDTRGLVSVTTSYDGRLGQFRDNYEAYARQLESALRIDCTTDPDAFYYAIDSARTLRSAVHQDVLALHAYIDDYRDEVVGFRGEIEQGEGR